MPKLRCSGGCPAMSCPSTRILPRLILSKPAINIKVVVLLGPSGSGKTTTLMLIAGFERISRGRILVDGQDIAGQPPEQRNFGIVFQGYALFPHMNVLDNVAFPLRMKGTGTRAR